MSKTLAIGVFSSVIFLGLFLHSLVFNLNLPQENHSDITYQYFIFENNLSKLAAGNFTGLWDTRMYYPRHNTLLLGNTFTAQSFTALPVYLATHDVILSTNLSMVINFFLAFLFSYLLAFFFTGNISASLIAALIYTYNPSVMSHSAFEIWSHQWIPAVFLGTELVLAKPNWKNSLFLALSFIFLITGTVYYSAYLLICWPIYLAVRWYQVKSLRITLPVLTCLLLTLITSAVYLYPYLGVKSTYHVTRSLEILQTYSAVPADFLFTSPRNLIYGFLTHSRLARLIRDPYVIEHYAEHSLFPGLAAALLSFACIVILRRHPVVFTYLILLIICIIFTFGPYLTVGRFQIPLPYLILLRGIPDFEVLRVPTRFMIIGTLGISMLAALFWQKFSSHRWLTVLIISIITLESLHQLPPPYRIPQPTLDFYHWLSSQSRVHVILELPMANNLVSLPEIYRNYMLDSQYLLYGTYHHQFIVNGYNSVIPPQATEMGNSLTINFPSPEKITALRKLHVDLLVVHLDEYSDPNRGRYILNLFSQQGYTPVYSSPNITAYAL